MFVPLPDSPITFAPHGDGLGIWRGSELLGVVEGARLLRLNVIVALVLDGRAGVAPRG